jgi:hypothetical protein
VGKYTADIEIAVRGGQQIDGAIKSLNRISGSIIGGSFPLLFGQGAGAAAGGAAGGLVGGLARPRRQFRRLPARHPFGRHRLQGKGYPRSG